MGGYPAMSRRRNPTRAGLDLAAEQWLPPGTYGGVPLRVARLTWVLAPRDGGARAEGWSLDLLPGDASGAGGWRVNAGPAFEQRDRGTARLFGRYGVSAPDDGWGQARGSLLEATAKLPLRLALIAQAMGPRLLELLDAGAGAFVDESP